MDNQQKTLNDFWRYWFFGLFDGDGGFCIQLWERKKGHIQRVPIIEIVNTNQLIINPVIDIYKRLGLAYYRRITSGNITQKPLHYVSIRGFKRVKRFLDAIGIYEGIKKVEFDLLKKYVDYRLSRPQSAFLDTREKVIISEFKNSQRHKLKEIIFNKLDKKSLAWLGGIYDAEGSMGLNYKKARKDHRQSYRSVIRISNTDKGIIDTIDHLFNLANIKFNRSKNEKKNRKTVYNLTVEGNIRCKKFLDIIGDYVVGKHSHVELLKEYVNLPSFKKLQMHKKEAKHIFEKLYLLNHQGILRDYTPSILKNG